MKYLNLEGTAELVENMQAWVMNQICLNLNGDVIMQAYNSNVGTNLTQYISAADFVEMYNAVNAHRIIIFSGNGGYVVPNVAWAYQSSGLNVVGVTVIDVFGGNTLLCCDFEFSSNGTTVILSFKTIRTLG